MSPVTSYRDYRYSYEPSYSTPTYRTEVVTLPMALQMAMDGRVDAMHVFNQSPEKLQEIIDHACQASFGRDFKHLTADERKTVFSMFLLALQNSGEGDPSERFGDRKHTAPISRVANQTSEKKWWQFWR
jgi:hypothetical protein